MEFYVDSVPKGVVVDMLRYEEQERYSERIQALFDQPHEVMSVEDNLQREVLKHFGYSSSDQSLNQYRLIPGKYKDDDEVRQAAYFIRYNIMVDGELGVGSEMVDVPLVSLDGTPCQLSDFVHGYRPLVILAGSVT